MTESLAILLTVAAAYAVGSIPFGWLVARLVKGVDIRTVGSGNIGATNVARSIGKLWGLLVLLLDAAKGLLPTYTLPLVVFAPSAPELTHLRVGCGLGTILGHMFPCWLGFRGGKGVATALGVVVVIAPLASAVAGAVFAVMFALTRVVSLSSLVASGGFAVAAIWRLWPTPFSQDSWSVAVFSIMAPLLIVVRHRSNLARLLRGEEPRFGQSMSVGPKVAQQDASSTPERNAAETPSAQGP